MTPRLIVRLALPMLICVVVTLAGCPLVSDKPLSDPAMARPDPALVGAWNIRDADTGEVHTLTFLPFNEHEMVAFAPGDSGSSVDAMRVFITAVDSEKFLNVQELGSDSTGWSLVRYRIETDRLILTVVDDGLFEGRQFASPEELGRFVRENLADPRLYAAAGEEREDMVLERGSREEASRP